MLGSEDKAPGSDPAEAGAPAPGVGSPFVQIGSGGIGGKAQGLARASEILASRVPPESSSAIAVDIPRFWVIGTGIFDLFMQENRLHEIAFSEAHDHHLAQAFQKARLPDELHQPLRALISQERGPLAVRSSSLLEDALREPFAGVYATKMLPNNQFSEEARLRTLIESIKFVYASTYFRDAKSYRRGTGHAEEAEKMAVIIQEMVGIRHGDRFYPTVSGVGRSYNFYSLGHARPEHGVVSLALGLGKTIVDGGRSWTYCPAHPKAKPPFGSTKELLDGTQTRFWAVNMGKTPVQDPTQEAEYLQEGSLPDAEADGVLPAIASTYEPQSDRVVMGTGSPGPRILTFAPLLDLGLLPVNEVIAGLLETCQEALDSPVEIEFALDIEGTSELRGRLGFLQVRPMLLSRDDVHVEEHELAETGVIVASDQVLGNGSNDYLQNIVYVKPDTFSAKDSWLIAAELDELNRRLLDRGCRYLLITIGRLGTSDPWLGIPARWAQVSGAKAIVEASTDAMNVDMSQGSHFFHNVTNLGVFYFSADRSGHHSLRWDWLERQRISHDGQFVRHVSLDKPLHIKVDGQQGRGVIRHEGSD